MQNEDRRGWSGLSGLHPRCCPRASRGGGLATSSMGRALMGWLLVGRALMGRALMGWLLVGCLLLGCLGLGCLGLGVGVPGAIAAPTDPAPPASSASSVPDASAIPAETVEQFATAYLQVLILIGDRSEELHRAETEAAAAQLEREIEAQALDIIQASGLSTTAYLKLLGLANVDSEFRERIAAQIQELH